MRWGILPKPTNPNVWPSICRGGSVARKSKRPFLTLCPWSAIFRIIFMKSAIACSATASADTAGVLATMIPSSVALGTGILSVPLPERMTTKQSGNWSRVSGFRTFGPPKTQINPAPAAVSNTSSWVVHCLETNPMSRLWS